MLSVIDPFQNIVPGFYCSTGPFILILLTCSIRFMNNYVSPYQMLVCIADALSRQPILISFGITCTMQIIDYYKRSR